MLRKSSAVIVAFVAVGSALFGGAALANNGHDGDDNTGGAGGAGGAATTYCVNSASQVPFLNTYDDFNDAGIDQENFCASVGGDGGDGGAGEIDLD
jgi:hypothetical protein